MRKNTEAGDYKNAIRYADVMLRSNDQLAPYVVPYLAHFADNQATIGAVKTLVDADPPWRSSVLLIFVSERNGRSHTLGDITFVKDNSGAADGRGARTAI